MIDPDGHTVSSRNLVLLAMLLVLPLAGCGARVVSKPAVDPGAKATKEVPANLPNWLGNSHRNFYGSGPWQDGPLEVIWEFETGFITGHLHEDPWGGTSWPGQPSVDGTRVYFPSADGNLYCLNTRDGSIVWQYKAKDSFKATPVIIYAWMLPAARRLTVTTISRCLLRAQPHSLVVIGRSISKGYL